MGQARINPGTSVFDRTDRDQARKDPRPTRAYRIGASNGVVERDHQFGACDASLSRPYVVAGVTIGEPTPGIQGYRFYLASAEVQNGVVGSVAIEPDVDGPRDYRCGCVCHFRVLHCADRWAGCGELDFENYWRRHCAILTNDNRRSRTGGLYARDRSVDSFVGEQPVVPEPAEILVQRVVHEQRVIPRRGMLEAPCLCVITHRMPDRGIADDAAKHRQHERGLAVSLEGIHRAAVVRVRHQRVLALITTGAAVRLSQAVDVRCLAEAIEA